VACRHGPIEVMADFPIPVSFILSESMAGVGCISEKPTALTKYLQTKLAVVEVKDGETQEEAWRRHLTSTPKYAKAHIKNFHYPAKDSLNKAKGHPGSFHSGNEEKKGMVENLIKKVQGGYQIDGLDLLRANCGCGGLTGPGGYGVGDCCQTNSTVRQENHTVAFFAKATTPSTKNNYEWGYRVKKGPVEVDVLVYDTRNPKDFTFGGKYPPPVSEWQARGWEILSQFERPLAGTGVKLPEWCQSPVDACVRSDKGLESPHGDLHRKGR
jgi:hypothetical protein